jgi:hypothetical protein
MRAVGPFAAGALGKSTNAKKRPMMITNANAAPVGTFGSTITAGLHMKIYSNVGISFFDIKERFYLASEASDWAR